MSVKMLGAILPGNSTVEMKEFDMPTPGYGQVVVKTKASTICGSDIRAIYRAHVGKGPEGYQPGMVAGHEPCGIIEVEGEGLKRFNTSPAAVCATTVGVVITSPARARFARPMAGSATAAWLPIFCVTRRI